MPQFAANLSLMYTELPFLERFGAAARDGFAGVEYLFPYAHEPALLAAQLRTHGLRQVLFNAPPGGLARGAMAQAWDQGARGTAALPGREAEFRAGVLEALHYAEQLDCPRIHLMAGCLPEGADPAACRQTYVDNLRWAAAQAGACGREVLIEPINPRDMPGYLLQRQDDAHAVLDAVGSPHLKVQMDLYHCQIVEGDLATKLRRYLPTGRVGHVQIAGVPERHEPDQGEVYYPYLFGLIDAWAMAAGSAANTARARVHRRGWAGAPHRRSKRQATIALGGD
jgi:hydroxypyruvate isomerase